MTSQLELDELVRGIFALPALYCSTACSKVVHVLVLALRTELPQRTIQVIQIILVLPTRSSMRHDVLSKRLSRLRSEKLRIVGKADVDQTFDRLWQRLVASESLGCVKGHILHRVSIDLSDIQVLSNFGDVLGRYPVGGSPCQQWCVRVLIIGQIGQDARRPS